MRIVAYKRIKEFAAKHADSELPLNVWYHTTTAKSWKHLGDIKQSFNSADYVGNYRYVFNIKGNNYRLIAIISFNAQKVYIRFIGTHAEYNKIKDIKTISHDTNRSAISSYFRTFRSAFAKPKQHRESKHKRVFGTYYFI